MTIDDTAIKVLDAMIGGPDDVAAVGRALVLIAARRGFVVTIETAPGQPLAMGNFGLEVDVRPLRSAQTRHVEQAQRDRNTEANDARVGRRQFNSHGWTGR